MFDTLKFEKSDELTMVLTRRFNAPRELVFAAYTTPALMGRWLIGPPGWSMKVCEFEPVAGFHYRLAWQNAADSSQLFGLGGTVLEIDPPHRMVTTELFDGQPPEAESVQTIELTEDGGITLLVQTNRYPTANLCDASFADHKDGGMDGTFDLLETLLEQLKSEPKPNQPAIRT